MTRAIILRAIVIFLLAVVLAGIAAKLYPAADPGCDPRDDSCAAGCP